MSSSGHLVLGQSILGLKEPELLFDVLLHVGTLAAVLIFYGKDLWRIARGWCASLAGQGFKRRRSQNRLALDSRLGPCGNRGRFLGGLIEQMFASPRLAACALLVTGGILCLSEPGEDAGRGRSANDGQRRPHHRRLPGVRHHSGHPRARGRPSPPPSCAAWRASRPLASASCFLCPRFRGAFALKIKDLEGPLGAKLLPYAVGAIAAALVGPSPWAGSSGSSEAAIWRASATTAGARAHYPRLFIRDGLAGVSPSAWARRKRAPRSPNSACPGTDANPEASSAVLRFLANLGAMVQGPHTPRRESTGSGDPCRS